VVAEDMVAVVLVVIEILLIVNHLVVEQVLNQL
jgi:hypothetical protein